MIRHYPLLVLLCSWCLLAPVGAADLSAPGLLVQCSEDELARADRLLQQALEGAARGAAPEETGRLLETARQSCATALVNIQRGRWLMQRGLEGREPALLEQAALAFSDALRSRHVADPRYLAMAQGYRAQALAELRRDCAAYEAFQRALAAYEGGRTPEWLQLAWRDFELRLEDDGISMDLLACQFRSAIRARPSRARVNVRVQFDSNRDDLTERAKGTVSDLAAALVQPELEGRHFRLVGHTDIRGEDSYNQELSRRRAASVRDELLRLRPQLGARLTAEGRGESEPTAVDPACTETSPPDCPAHRLNRRVEVLIE